MIGMTRQPSKRVAFVSSYLPRRCGIATFASHLIKNMALAGREEFEPTVIAMQSGYETRYSEPVRVTIRKDVKYDYIRAANYINSSDIDVVSVQHEFGLFGGCAGSYLNILLRKLNKPVITTLHTVLQSPSTEYFDSLNDTLKASDKIIVMNSRGVKMLVDIYGTPARKIKLIPHGVPDLPFSDGNDHKHKLGISSRKVILTFGLLSRNKGIEVMLRALPTIAKIEPSVLYVILGATHPDVLRHEGQCYTLKLDKMVKDLGLQDNVAFHNRFVGDEELYDFLRAADIYVTPYLHKEQLTSGTLAFAVGAGKAVVSTPYWAAEELLARGRGRLVPFGDSRQMADSIVEILSDDSLFIKMRKLAYEYGRSMIWPNVGQSYWQLFGAQEPSLAASFSGSLNSPDRKRAIYSRREIWQPA